MTGVVLATSAFVTFSMLELMRLAGFLTNAYIGLITYLLFPALFVIGLILIPIGWRILKKRTGRTTRELLNKRFEPTEIQSGFFGSRIFATVAILTLLNVVFMGAASSRMLQFMDEAEFCGTACHDAMNPEWVTYQQSPHARVKCVECHVGEGAEALLDSKLNGMWQIISLTFDLYERPIETPVRQLRPARETCEKCHWPDKFYGSRLKNIVRFETDSASTPKYTTLNLKVDAGSGRIRRGIHWHISEKNIVRYASVGDKREEMIWVEAMQPDGSFKRYRNPELSSETERPEDVRALDCIDCHNRATHIYEDPADAVDDRIRFGDLDRSLPYLRREAYDALVNDYPNQVAAMDGIANHIRGYYEREFPEVALREMALIDSTIEVLQHVYNRNVHFGMNIRWGTYKSHLGHRDDGGCFRCHSSELVDENGESISDDCTTCHSILALEESEPFAYVNPPDSTDRESAMHAYLRQEFARLTAR
jgi:hypothetical protein